MWKKKKEERREREGREKREVGKWRGDVGQSYNLYVHVAHTSCNSKRVWIHFFLL
jgi:hypothetical protein